MWESIPFATSGLSPEGRITSRLLQILPSDWLSYSLSIGDRSLAAKGVDFHIQNNGEKLAFCKIIFCPTSWFILKQLGSSPLLSMYER